MPLSEPTLLIRWYDKYKRDLPWRKTTDPYKILVSEMMLQQTQVDRVRGFYRSWLKTFPNWRVLAKASNAQVIHAWSGLGYNRRALALRDIAKQVADHGVPKSREAWLALKGVGPYTSAAVALFAQGEKVFPVDSIIRRVIGRFSLGKPFATAKDDARIEQAGLAILSRTKRYQDIPQAIFDLATLVCKKEPDCARCPLRRSCKMAPRFLGGKVPIPKRSIQKGKERIHSGKTYPDRIYRGRILKAVKNAERPLRKEQLIPLVDHSYVESKDGGWFEGMLSRLTREGFLKHNRGRYELF